MSRELRPSGLVTCLERGGEVESSNVQRAETKWRCHMPGERRAVMSRELRPSGHATCQERGGEEESSNVQRAETKWRCHMPGERWRGGEQ